MLIMQMVQSKTEILHCRISNQLIMYGDFYYQDMDDPTIIIKADVYKDMQRKARMEKFDYTELQKANDQRTYEEILRKAEREALINNVLNEPVLENGKVHENGID